MSFLHLKFWLTKHKYVNTNIQQTLTFMDLKEEGLSNDPVNLDSLHDTGANEVSLPV